MNGNPDEIRLHNKLVDDYLMLSPGLPQTMESASLSEAPLTKCLLAQLVLMANTADTTTAAATLVSRMDSRSLNSRERMHLQAVVRQASGDTKGASDVLDNLVRSLPFDVAALRLLHFSLFNQGRITDMLRSIDEARQHWSTGLPRKSLLDGMYSFALCESGRFASAEQFGRDAVSKTPNDLWSVHSVAHVLEMQGRWDSGVRWIRASDDALQVGSSFSGHVWWHLALYLLECGRHDQALALFDDLVYPIPSIEGLALTNAVALLCRLEFVGVDVGARWERLTEGVSHRLGHHTQPFNDCHYAYALGRLGKTDKLTDLLTGMAKWAEGNAGGHAGEVIRQCGLAVAKGMGDLGQGKNDLARNHLAEVNHSWWRLGGSAAQRDLFTQALLRAEIHCRTEESNDLAAARVKARPKSPQAKIWEAFAVEATGGDGSSAKAEAIALGWEPDSDLKSPT